jgi:nucleotidyltransferase AbiEii toxin of type IV toxin-antitoxin system
VTHAYASPQALRQAVDDRLRHVAKQQPATQLADLQRQFAYDRLLCRVFQADRNGWVLKGATAMLARLGPTARHTMDVDL